MNDARPGDTSLNNSSLNQRNQVKAWIDKADATGDAGDGFADDSAHGRSRVDRLSSQVGDISSEVQDAELTYGILPAPAAPVGVAAAPPAAPAAGATALPYVLGGAGIVAVLLLAGVI
jgi:hypothetical protein